MSEPRHWVEMVSERLADAIEHEIEMLANYLRPKGEAPPFSERVSLDWWRRHRHDAYGERVLSTMDPTDIMALDAALADQIERERLAPPIGAL